MQTHHCQLYWWWAKLAKSVSISDRWKQTVHADPIRTEAITFSLSARVFMPSSELNLSCTAATTGLRTAKLSVCVECHRLATIICLTPCPRVSSSSSSGGGGGGGRSTSDFCSSWKQLSLRSHSHLPLASAPSQQPNAINCPCCTTFFNRQLTTYSTLQICVLCHTATRRTRAFNGCWPLLWGPLFSGSQWTCRPKTCSTLVHAVTVCTYL